MSPAFIVCFQLKVQEQPTYNFNGLWTQKCTRINTQSHITANIKGRPSPGVPRCMEDWLWSVVGSEYPWFGRVLADVAYRSKRKLTCYRYICIWWTAGDKKFATSVLVVFWSLEHLWVLVKYSAGVFCKHLKASVMVAGLCVFFRHNGEGTPIFIEGVLLVLDIQGSVT